MATKLRYYLALLATFSFFSASSLACSLGGGSHMITNNSSNKIVVTPIPSSLGNVWLGGKIVSGGNFNIQPNAQLSFAQTTDRLHELGRGQVKITRVSGEQCTLQFYVDRSNVFQCTCRTTPVGNCTGIEPSALSKTCHLNIVVN